MSLKKNATRRLSLLAGSSVVAASLTAFAGVALAPTSAMAANECGNPSANGGAADVLTCPPGTYASGIDYSTTSDGDLTVILRDRVNTGTSNTAGSGPILMYGDTGENMNLLREDTVGVVGDPRIVNTAGAGRAIDISTLGDGNILINLTDGDPAAGEPNTPVATAPAPLRITGSTDAVRANAQGSGNVDIIFAATGVPSGSNHLRTVITAGTAVGSNGAGILARSVSGTITIDAGATQINGSGANAGGAISAQSTSGNIEIESGNSVGRLYGIYAATGGAGSVDITTSGNTTTTGTSGAGIEAVSGFGGTTISINAGVTASSGIAIRAGSTSTSATTAVNVQINSGTVNGGVDFMGGMLSSGVNSIGASAGGTTFNLLGGNWLAGGGESRFSNFSDRLTIGAGATGSSTAGGLIDLAGGDDIWALAGTFTATGTGVDFGAGNDAFNVSGRLNATGTTLNFGAGADVFGLTGVMAVSGGAITNLEAFNHSGLIILGAGVTADVSDGVTDDVFRMDSGTFTGSASGRVLMDVQFGDVQEGCAVLTGAADCMDLRGATTAGATMLTLNSVGAAATQAGYDIVGITLVDVGGGTSAAGHFVLDPDTANFAEDGLYGQVIERPGLFVATLRYDADTQRHSLVTLPRSGVMNYAMLSGAAQSIWQMTAETVTDRQTDLRRGTEGSLWLRGTGEYTTRDTASSFEGPSETFTIDNSYKLYAGTIMGGMDLISGTSGGYDYVLGAQIGYVSSSFDLDAAEVSGQMTGATGGVYGSVWSERLFLDGTFNMNGLTLDHESPALGAKTNTYLNSIGARLEGGYRWMLTKRTFVEPLATAAFSRTSFEEISLFGGQVQPADASSRRGALGLRLGSDLTEGPINVGYFVAGRAWNEFDGDSKGVVNNPGLDLPFADEFSGGFGEAEAGVNLFNEAGTLSGFLTSGVKFKDGYSATNLSLGLNMRW